MSVNSSSNVLEMPSEAAPASFSLPGIYAEHQAVGQNSVEEGRSLIG